jgi:hypothetical protein
VKSLYLFESIRESASERLIFFTLIIQAANASLFTIEGSLEIAGLISITSPLKGAYKSSAAFTDSIVPKLCPFFTSLPIFGKSTNTMSPNAFCAKSEIPKVAVSPSIFHPFMFFCIFMSV